MGEGINLGVNPLGKGVKAVGKAKNEKKNRRTKKP